VEDLYASVGYGGISAAKIVGKLHDEYVRINKIEPIENKIIIPEKEVKPRDRKNQNMTGIVVKGIDNCLIRLSRCCNPVPGDDIIGYITRGRGVSVHRRDCPNVLSDSEDGSRLIGVNWEKSQSASYLADLQILATDRTGLLLDIANSISDSKLSVSSINTRTLKDKTAIINITIEINNTEQLDKIIKKLQRIQSIYEVTRSRQ
jgi:GTP pyrophosphokinase